MKKVKSVKVDARSIDNLYRYSNKQPAESLDTLRVEGTLPDKVIAIALKEWFFSIRKGGSLEITYRPDRIVTQEWLEKKLWWLFHGTYTIVEHVRQQSKNKLIIRKTEQLFAQGDSMDKWSFGIVTNGDRNEWVEQMIGSIRNQKIPHYEIIICGNYGNRKEKDIVYVPFNERSDRGWITRKKNIIGEHAQYENICILHDRIVLNPQWYAGMKTYGNTFELLGCVQIDRETGVQAGDWVSNGGPIEQEYAISRLDYRDWDKFVYLSGQLTITKKSAWRQILWDETRYWNDKEDADISFRARDAGYITRFNPYAATTALSWRHGKLPLKYNPQDGIVPKDMLVRRTIRSIGRIVYAVPSIRHLIPIVFRVFEKTPLYKHMQHH